MTRSLRSTLGMAALLVVTSPMLRAQAASPQPPDAGELRQRHSVSVALDGPRAMPGLTVVRYLVAGVLVVGLLGWIGRRRAERSAAGSDESGPA